ncbi:hypothetical protein EZJ43_08470 [Pedobacter changchengzhani]|uniref:Uncharacterized protein n=1 Tax=Pedobacter changchengzhani TaxID=2529274 RepID=A0A4R5MLI1_9SPHI|nr:hypothetical protein [Pedobacter changchengzhani]TDG36541.1 hypothetical protein EZJ43_08470 [Pedobacter changchengzhani]
MTTLTIQVDDKDTDFLLQVLKRINGKIVKTSKKENLLDGIKKGLQEAKQISEGKLQPLSLKDI